MTGGLWLVATPIGNLADLSPRAVEVLGSAALICCEDTRRTGRLLQHAGISGARLAVANEHTERRRIAEVVDALDQGDTVAVVSDAGTPAISDPGAALVRAALDAGHDVSAVPGPDAATTALVISGLPTDRFVFEGFLPRRAGIRRDRIAALVDEPRTVVLHVSPHRAADELAELSEALGDRPAALARELTKLHEQVLRLPLPELADRVAADGARGELTLVVGGATPPDAPDDEALLARVDERMARNVSMRDAVAAVAAEAGVARRRLYELTLRARDRRGAG